jgi:hypothetical protein
VADFREALGSIMGRLSEGETPDEGESRAEADWFLFGPREVPNFSSKPGQRPYLRLVAEDFGMTTLYPRSSLKGDAPSGRQMPDKQYPQALVHRAHTHGGRGCGLNKDATVIACEPRQIGSYHFRSRARECRERDLAWLRLFEQALDELANCARVGDVRRG